jgi:hypothetical protein
MTAQDRYGNTFTVEEVVQLVDYPQFDPKKWMSRKLQIVEISECDHSESGFNVLLKDVQTDHTMKRPIDTNWIQKCKD